MTLLPQGQRCRLQIFPATATLTVPTPVEPISAPSETSRSNYRLFDVASRLDIDWFVVELRGTAPRSRCDLVRINVYARTTRYSPSGLECQADGPSFRLRLVLIWGYVGRPQPEGKPSWHSTVVCSGSRSKTSSQASKVPPLPSTTT